MHVHAHAHVPAHAFVKVFMCARVDVYIQLLTSSGPLQRLERGGRSAKGQQAELFCEAQRCMQRNLYQSERIIFHSEVSSLWCDMLTTTAAQAAQEAITPQTSNPYIKAKCPKMLSFTFSCAHALRMGSVRPVCIGLLICCESSLHLPTQNHSGSRGHGVVEPVPSLLNR